MRSIRAGLVACWLAAAACSVGGSAAPSGSVSTLDHLPVTASFRSYHVPTQVGLMTSVADMGAGHYLLCDPVNVYRVTRGSSGYTVGVLAKPNVPRWNPVGLAYRDGLLYVANGAGRDVLVLRIVGSALSLVRRVASPDLQDAESVVALSDRSIVVADQVGNAVLGFQADGTQQWRLPVAGAHGLAQSGDHLFVSSLSDGTIHELDQSGRPLRSAGGIGVSTGRYLWPAGLAADAGRLLVTDAHNGRITVLDDSLRVTGRVGGNGPGLDAFNFPFAAVPLTDGYLVVDTYRYRLVRTDQSWAAIEQLSLGRDVTVGRERPLVLGTDAHPHTYAMLPGVDLAAALGLRKPQTFVGALDGLDHVGPDGRVAHLDVVDPQYGSTGLTWAQAVGQYIVIGSCQGSTMEVIDPATGMFTFVEVGHDTWWRAGQLLLSVNLRRTLSDAVAPAKVAFAQATLLLSRGVPRQNAFNQALAAGRPRNWSQDLGSPAAQRFLHSGMTRADASAFFATALSQPELHAVELLEVKYLSGS